MIKPKLSQTVLLEILVTEIESFKKTQSAHQKLFDAMGQHLERLDELYNRPLTVDIAPFELAHAQLQSTLKKGLYTPRWVWITFFTLFIFFVGSCIANYMQNNRISDLEEEIASLSSSKRSKSLKK